MARARDDPAVRTLRVTVSPDKRGIAGAHRPVPVRRERRAVGRRGRARAHLRAAGGLSSRSRRAESSLCWSMAVLVHGRAPGSEPTYSDELLEILRLVVVAGLSVGILVIGVGSRLAMLLLRLTSPGTVIGVTSDDGFVIGRTTLSGTYNLLSVGGGGRPDRGGRLPRGGSLADRTAVVP